MSTLVPTVNGMLSGLQVSLDYWTLQVLNGLSYGLILVLISLGLTLILGILRVINFAHGSLLLVGAYIALTITSWTGSILLGFLGAFLVSGSIGLLIERYTLRYMYDQPIYLQLLLTYAIALIIASGVKIAWGANGKQFPIPSWGEGAITVLGFSYPLYRSYVIAISLFIVVGLFLFITRTNFGAVIRAGAEDREMVGLLGINISYVNLLVFIIGSGIAGLAGALIGPIQGATPDMGNELLIPSFVVVATGGMGSIQGSLVAGLVIGQIVVLTGAIYPPMQEVIIYVIMAVVLLVRPQGLFGTPGDF